MVVYCRRGFSPAAKKAIDGLTRLWFERGSLDEDTGERPRQEWRLALEDIAALDVAGSLSGTTGAVLDPIFALRVRVRLEPRHSAAVAFTSKHAACLGLGARQVAYGRQPEPFEGVVVFVLASPSGRARSFWTIEPWRAAAAFVAERRALRERAA